MRRIAEVTVFVLLVAVLATLQSAATDEQQTRMLSGQVTNRADAPLANAVVYLKNTKTLSVKTFITDSTGGYRFPELSKNIDYEIYAEHNGAKSDTKTLSSFDGRPKPVINLRVVAGK